MVNVVLYVVVEGRSGVSQRDQATAVAVNVNGVWENVECIYVTIG